MRVAPEWPIGGGDVKKKLLNGGQRTGERTKGTGNRQGKSVVFDSGGEGNSARGMVQH